MEIQREMVTNKKVLDLSQPVGDPFNMLLTYGLVASPNDRMLSLEQMRDQLANYISVSSCRRPTQYVRMLMVRLTVAKFQKFHFACFRILYSQDHSHEAHIKISTDSRPSAKKRRAATALPKHAHFSPSVSGGSDSSHIDQMLVNDGMFDVSTKRMPPRFLSTNTVGPTLSEL